MKFINSQYITADLTHMTPPKDYESMKKNGIKKREHYNGALIYKPPGFWISINSGWEEWCDAENFRDVKNDTICDIYLKPNLTFIRISTIEDADELVRFLVPEMVEYYSKHYENNFSLSSLITFSRYEIGKFRRDEKVSQKTIWQNAFDICDGLYYENSWDLHIDTFFNAWDCDSLTLFDPDNIVSLIKQDR